MESGGPDLDALDAADRDRVEFLYQHEYQVLYGCLPPDGETVREVNPLDAPTEPMTVRLERKVAELGRLGHPTTVRTLQRQIAAYQAEGPVGLVDGRKRRTGGRRVRLLRDRCRALTWRAPATAATAHPAAAPLNDGAVRRVDHPVRQPHGGRGVIHQHSPQVRCHADQPTRRAAPPLSLSTLSKASPCASRRAGRIRFQTKAEIEQREGKAT